jgi:TPR repeat protein
MIIYNQIILIDNLGFLYRQADKGDSNAMFKLGMYYQNIERDYDLMKKYYLLAAENKNMSAMNNLELFYFNNPLSFYLFLSKSKNKTQLITNKIKELKNNNKLIQKYDDKLKYIKY